MLNAIKVGDRVKFDADHINGQLVDDEDTERKKRKLPLSIGASDQHDKATPRTSLSAYYLNRFQPCLQ
jgi:hypothetical protein